MSVVATHGAHNPLGHFLRGRREQLGLSREGLVGKILMRTGCRVSAGHCYRVETGNRLPSADTLELIADGLQLNPAERAYVHSLIDWKPRPTPVAFHQVVSEAVRRVLDFQEPAPAYVVDRKLDILAWNSATCDIYGSDLDDVPEERHYELNVAWMMFNSTPLASRLRDWASHAQRIVAQCRNRWAEVEKDTEIQGILQRMLQNPQFATWWDQPKVALRSEVRKVIDHPDVEGPLVLEQTVFPVGDNTNLDMVLAIPLPESNTAQKLKDLATLRRLEAGRPPALARDPRGSARPPSPPASRSAPPSLLFWLPITIRYV